MVETWVRRIEAGDAALDDIKQTKIREKVRLRLIEDRWIDDEE